MAKQSIWETDEQHQENEMHRQNGKCGCYFILILFVILGIKQFFF